MDEQQLHKVRFGKGFIAALDQSATWVSEGPDEEIHRLDLDTTQRHPEECLCIDDRAVNVECADRVGIPTIQFHDPAQLEGRPRTSRCHCLTERSSDGSRHDRPRKDGRQHE